MSKPVPVPICLMLVLAIGLADVAAATDLPAAGFQAPTADAGPDITVLSGSTGTLDGTGSTDPDGTITSYFWLDITGHPPQLPIVNHTDAIATFTAPFVTDFRFWTIGLEVIDNDGIPDTDTMTVAVLNPDVDGDGISHFSDNCLNVPNAMQTDSDGDGFGNRCDADLDNDCTVDAADLGLLRLLFFTADADADFNDDGVVNVLDLGVMKGAFFQAPGPSGTATCQP